MDELLAAATAPRAICGSSSPFCSAARSCSFPLCSFLAGRFAILRTPIVVARSRPRFCAASPGKSFSAGVGSAGADEAVEQHRQQTEGEGEGQEHGEAGEQAEKDARYEVGEGQQGKPRTMMMEV